MDSRVQTQQNNTIMPAPRISVCVAAFNGGKYIETQLRSILSQLGAKDEVVIVDDCSLDDTVAKIQGMQDERIHLVQHLTNQGVVASVEEALCRATGDILFLSDDDDIWAENKVKRYLEVFEARPDVQIVTSRVRLIDIDGNPYTDDRLIRNGEFWAGFWRNVYKNHYQGSAMAIRSSLLERVLPFPVRPAFLHDAWIGTRNAITGGKAVFIKEELLFYRRHPDNFSRRLSAWNRLRARVELLCAHASYPFRSRNSATKLNQRAIGK
jgi:glycosyltransferase involved in cell wall biosynthesis